MVEIKRISDMGGNTWAVDYSAPVPCGCYFDRKTIIIKQKNKPTEKQINAAINKQQKL